MKLLAVNGSPRKDGNVARLLTAAMAAAEKQGAEVELIHLYDLDYKGCISCFACKRLPEPAQVCVQRDQLTPILEKAYTADGLLLGSPIYFANLSSGMRAFLERLMYCYPHQPNETNTFKPVGCVYSMNASAEQVTNLKYDICIDAMENFLRRNFVSVKSVWANNTYQFKDYSKYKVAVDLELKIKVRDQQFPLDLQAAGELGYFLVSELRSKQ